MESQTPVVTGRRAADVDQESAPVGRNGVGDQRDEREAVVERPERRDRAIENELPEEAGGFRVHLGDFLEADLSRWNSSSSLP
jgi:hypothetical protein